MLTLIAVSSMPSYATRRVAVAQLTQILTSDKAANKRDAEMAAQMSGLVLTERLTDVTLDRLTASPLSSPVLLALHLLADQSAFLSPPVNELPTAAAPDEGARQQILDAGRQYALQTLPHLPDFLATRTGLRLVDRSSREITIRDAREDQLPTQSSGVWRQATGLVSRGEFGATLGMILIDTPKGSVSWPPQPAISEASSKIEDRPK